MDKREADTEVDDKTHKLLRISTAKARDDSHLEIKITDSGEGIAPGDLDRIFDPFFTTKDVGSGTGLGLSISYGIIKDHQGEIEVAETGPEGTTFRVRLPISHVSPGFLSTHFLSFHTFPSVSILMVVLFIPLSFFQPVASRI